MEDRIVEISGLKHGEDKGNDAKYKTNPKINEIWERGSYKIED